ncbi:MAG: hypothetical protein F4Y80_11290 [Caldilineaceae bacterium SB0665_bin_21]|nr:hypothetical protein [Caldilineaceae bacterium SB0665_bin_21]
MADEPGAAQAHNLREQESEPAPLRAAYNAAPPRQVTPVPLTTNHSNSEERYEQMRRSRSRARGGW